MRRHGSAQSTSVPLVHCPPIHTHTSCPPRGSIGTDASHWRREGWAAQLSAASGFSAAPASRLAVWQHLAGDWHMPDLTRQHAFAVTGSDCRRLRRRLRQVFSPAVVASASSKSILQQNRMGTTVSVQIPTRVQIGARGLLVRSRRT
eukprot:6059478-Prymnesium_polylepis.2